MEQSESLISCACGREYAPIFEHAICKGEMTARIDEVAVPKLAVLELMIVNMNPPPLEFLIPHHLNLVGTKGFLII